MEKLILIDGNSLLNRAYYATPVFTTKDGFPTNAVFGFIKLLLKIASDKKPEYLAVAFDLHAPTFRHKMYDGYKAGRKPMPDDLAKQIPVLKETLALMNVTTCELAGYEADDIIGTLAKRFPVQTYVYTGDRDSYQLVDDTTSVCFTKRGVTDLLELTKNNFKAETGLIPSQIIDLKSLMGDSSDNIPGVPGVGEKTAHALLEKYGNLDGVYEHIDEIVGATKRKLEEGKESAYFSYKLATIDTNAPIDVRLSDCVFKNKYSSAVRKKFAELEFKSLVNLSVFEEENGSEQTEQTEKTFAVQLRTPSSVQEGLEAVQNARGEQIAAHLSGNEFRFCLIDGNKAEEYAFPVKEDLLSVGFYANELTPLYNALFGGVKRVLVYNQKELRHRLENNSVRFCAPVEDVALMKYIAEGTGNAESLEYALDYHGFPSDKKAFGVYLLYEKFDQDLNEEERKLYREIELPLTDVLFDMEQEGVCVDETMIDELSLRYKAELKELTDKIYEAAGETFNVNSPSQLGKILFEKLRLGGGKPQKSKTSKGYSTTAEVLEKMSDEHAIIPLILRYRQVQKLNSTYLEGFKPLVKEGKIHTTYNQTNTATGRLSSANPNLQNVPVRNDEGKELRKIFKASEGNMLVDADYSQIELRLLAHFSDCKKLKEAYNARKDIHTHTAAEVFGVPELAVTREMRREAKAVNFGIIYGISPFGLAKDLSISTKKAKEYIDKYFETYDEVKNYMTKNVDNAKRDGYVKTVCGRRRVIDELKSSNFNLRAFGERAAMNMPLQGSSADIIKIAMINVYNRLKEEGLKAKLVLQVHDELVIDCPTEEQEKVSNILKTEMENAVSLRVPLIADVGVGKNWFDAH